MIHTCKRNNDVAARLADERNKGVTFKNCAPFTKCISRINNTDIDNAHDVDIVMTMYNLIEYSDNYSKTSGSLWQYYKDDPNDNLTDSESFKSKIKITGNTPAAGNTEDVEIIIPLKYLSNFWRTLEMPLINYEVNLILTWPKDCVITNATGEGKFAITETKLYVPVVTLSTKDNEKLLQQLKSGFKKTINWNKHESSIKTFAGGFLGKLLGPLLKTGLPLMKSVITSVAKSVLIPLGLTAAASAADAGMHKKILGSGNNTTLIISNKDMDDLIKIVKSLEDSGLLLKGITESVPNEIKEQKGGFLSMLLGTVGASLLGNLLTGKGVNKKGKGIHRADEGVVKAGEGNMDF